LEKKEKCLVIVKAKEKQENLELSLWEIIINVDFDYHYQEEF
jgi:hypothetical protein